MPYRLEITRLSTPPLVGRAKPSTQAFYSLRWMGYLILGMFTKSGVGHTYKEDVDSIADFLEQIVRLRHFVRAAASRATGMRQSCRAFVLGVLLCLATPVGAAHPPPLQMGVLPYLSSERLFTNFLPMRDYLEAQLGRRIVMSTAPNFEIYMQRAARGDYDIYQTAPHFALLAETEYGYRRVARYMRDLGGNVIVRNDAPVHRIEDLRGQIVITPDALAITSFLGEQLLQQHALLPGRDYRILRSTSHNNAVMTVYRRQAAAALTSAAVFEQLPPEIRRELRVLAKTREVPHMMVMAHPRLSEPDYARLKSALLAFTRAGPGRKFFATTGYDDMGPITDADMESLRPVLEGLKEYLK